MTRIVIETRIQAPIELCFDLARDVSAHAESAAFTSERVLEPGRTQGLLEIGDIVAFEGRHFGMTQRFVARITALDRPTRFVDEMVEGTFKRLRHVHEFEFNDGTTIMRDTLNWVTPFKRSRSSRRFALSTPPHALVCYAETARTQTHRRRARKIPGAVND